MKILSLYAGPSRGGCYDRLVRLHTALARRGVIVHAVTQSVAEEPVPGLVPHSIDGPSGSPSLLQLTSVSRLAGRVAREERVDGFLAFGSANAALLLPFRHGRRLVTFLRGSWIEQERARGSGPLRLACAKWIERRAISASAGVLAVSRGVAPPYVHPLVIPNDAPAPHLIDRATARELLNLPQEAFIAGTLGLPAPIKSIETVIGAALAVPPVHIAICGLGSSTPYEAFLRVRADDLVKTGRAHLRGWVTRNVFLSAIDVLVVASRHEGSPNGLLEGMAAGLPCLGSRVPGVEETLVEDAMLFPFGDERVLAARLRELQDRPQARADLARRAVEQSRRYRFDWDEVASDAVLRVLREDRTSE